MVMEAGEMPWWIKNLLKTRVQDSRIHAKACIPTLENRSKGYYPWGKLVT